MAGEDCTAPAVVPAQRWTRPGTAAGCSAWSSTYPALPAPARNWVQSHDVTASSATARATTAAVLVVTRDRCIEVGSLRLPRPHVPAARVPSGASDLHQ